MINRYATSVSSAANLAAGAVVAALFPPTSKTINIRRVTLGGRGASTSGQVAAALIFGESSGTAADNFPGQPTGLGQFLGENNAQGVAHGLFSTDPIYGSDPLLGMSFASIGEGASAQWDSGELSVQYANGNSSLLVYNVAAVPSGFLYTVSFEFEVVL